MRLTLVAILLLILSCEERRYNDEESFVFKNQHKIQVKTIGKGKPIIFAHGGYLDLEMWNPQINEFKKSNLTISFSDLGHGNTVRSANSIKGFEIINELTKPYPNEKFVLVGLSWGAMLSVDFTLNHPDKVEKLILVSPGLNGWNYFQDSLALKNYELRLEAIQNLDTLKSAKLFHQNWVVGPRRHKSELDQSFYQKSLDMVVKNMSNHWQEDWSELDTAIARDRLENIQVPTYIIIGSEDADDIRLIAEEYNQRIKYSKKIVVDKVAHLINMEKPAEFNILLKNILNE